MKPVFSLSIFIFLLSNVAMTQTRSGRQSDLRFAFVLKPQISWLKSDNERVESNGNVAGYNFGVVLDKFFAKNYAWSTGLTINNTGGKLRYLDEIMFNDYDKATPLSPKNSSFEYKLKYLEVPFNLKLQTDDFNRTSYYGKFGVAGQLLIRPMDGNGKYIDDEVSLVSLGYQFGGGMQYSIGGNVYLVFGLEFSEGLTDITNNKSVNDKTNLNRLILNFGVIF